MSRVIHQFNDPSLKTLIGLIRDNPWAQERVKEANVDPSYGESLPNSAFAWEDRRMFPLDTSSNALVSYLYAEKQASAVPDSVKTAIVNALDVYGVPVETVRVSENETEKTAGNADFAFPEKQRWGMYSDNDVKLAEERLLQIDNEISFMEKTSAAVNIVKAARKHGIEPSIELLKLAGAVAGDINKTIDWLEVRAYVAEGDVSDYFSKLAADLGSVDPLCYSRDNLIKLAEAIDILDEAAGIKHLYNRSIPTPVDTVFNTEKKAEETVSINGKDVPLSKLEALPEQVWDHLLGEDVEDVKTNGKIDIKKLALVVPTLPRDILVELGPYMR